ncbi:hypothetical protein B0J15DRAFT_485134 [Fusarium solani]|uniref:Uncharacterized protein n=1 Tax=Fusarium solani TaxID=169388 RepID=A0A9P9KZL3_FUSSL|nr:uncharacterized protein B0J15DRAFT_485134 [Fusarium solani]KAH7271484.1 hypothetical protein B0J15DRAFT_485134 [Fusarium solani]
MGCFASIPSRSSVAGVVALTAAAGAAGRPELQHLSDSAVAPALLASIFPGLALGTKALLFVFVTISKLQELRLLGHQ